MQRKLGTEELQFLARLSKSPDGHALLNLLRAELADLDKKLRKATGDDTVRLQGRAQQVDELIVAIESASTTLNRSRTTQPGGSLQALRAMG